jgi:hypothetical protein
MIYDLEKQFENLNNIPSDINEHFPAMLKYGSECNHITEMGVRGICSTWAWLACEPKDALYCYDLHNPSTWGGDIQPLIDTANFYGINFKFIEANVLNIDIEPTDLLFIDTWHVYDQLKAELARHHKQVKKYICFHDTTTFAHRGEATTSHHDFHGELTPNKGLWDAVTEFLDEHSDEWELVERFENNNGFTIIKRK